MYMGFPLHQNWYTAVQYTKIGVLGNQGGTPKYVRLVGGFFICARLFRANENVTPESSDSFVLYETQFQNFPLRSRVIEQWHPHEIFSNIFHSPVPCLNLLEYLSFASMFSLN